MLCSIDWGFSLPREMGNKNSKLYWCIGIPIHFPRGNVQIRMFWSSVGVKDLLIILSFGLPPPATLQVTNMARYLLEKHPEVLLGGDCLPAGELRCQQFWEKFKSYQPSHLVYKHHKDRLHQVIPVCLHGDKGRTLKKSPIACYSWEWVWGLPPNLRHTNDESQLKKNTEQKYDTGRLGQTCSERPGWTEGDIAAGQCTIKRRRLSDGSDERIQTHNSLGYLAQYIFSKPGMQCVYMCILYIFHLYILYILHVFVMFILHL